jgi:hypothetical protein
MTAPTNHAGLLSWVEEIAKMTQPDSIAWCNGSKAEYDSMVKITVEGGLATPLAKRPNSYLFRSDASDVARVENRTFIASKSKDDAGPTNNWIDPAELKHTMKKLYTGCMRGRVMYVIPFSMGPVGSPIAKIGIQITDSEIPESSSPACTALANIFFPVRMTPGNGLALPSRRNTSPISLKKGPFGPMARDMAEMLSSARSALRCASLRSLPGMKAGSPNTC